jgi:hypothetical protein
MRDQCHYAECPYSEFCYAEHLGAVEHAFPIKDNQLWQTF